MMENIQSKLHTYFKSQNLRICIALILALLIVTNLSRFIFIADTPRIDQIFLSSLPQRSKEWIAARMVRPTPTSIPKPTSIITKSPMNLSITPPITDEPTVTPNSQRPTLTTVPTSSNRPTVTRVPIPTKTSTPIPKKTATPTPRKPTPTRPPSNSSCSTTSGEQYGSRGLNPPQPNAEASPDTNPFLRGWGVVNESLSLVTYGYPNGEPPDPRAPQLGTILNNGASFTKTYKIHQWDWTNNRPSQAYEGDWPVHVLGFSASPGQLVHAPDNGYDIGAGYQYMVVYVSPTSISMNVTGDDGAIDGYALHLEGFCVDPNLLSLYKQLNSAGRHSLPALHEGQKIGTASSGEVRVMVRDSGSFLDPRSKGDWWVGY